MKTISGERTTKNNKYEKLSSLIASKEAKIVVIGLGYVGLPTAALFAKLGFKVKGVDINPRIVDQVNNGLLQTQEIGLQEIIAASKLNGNLSAVVSLNAITDFDVVIVCVQTPVDKKGNSNLSYLGAACKSLAKALTPGKFIIIQSTVPAKTNTDFVLPILQEESGLQCGEDFWLAYCPERLSPGSGLQDLSENTRLIGAYDSNSAALGRLLFETATKGNLLVTNIDSAEVSKLAENTFRYVNIAFANELAILCKKIDVDVKEVIRLANSHPRVNIHQPGSGAGGPCLSKDTHLLLSSTTLSGGFEPEVIPAAIKINDYMPRYIANLATDALLKLGKRIDASTIAVFGTAYKGDVDDPRDSPAEGVIKELTRQQAKLIVYDPYCEESFGQRKAKSLEEAVKDADCIVIATEHHDFRSLNLQQIKLLMKKNPIIVDSKRIIDPANARNSGFVYIASSGVLT